MLKITIYIKKILKSVTSFFTHKEYNHNKIPKKTVYGNDAKIRLYLDTSNTVLKIDKGDKIYYLKPLAYYDKKIKSLKAYIKEFFAIIRQENNLLFGDEIINGFENYVYKTFDIKTCKKFVNCLLMKKDYSVFFDGLDKGYSDIEKTFCTYVWASLRETAYRPLIRFGKFGICGYNKSKAVFILSKMLHIENLIEDVFFMEFVLNDVVIYGSATQEVVGETGDKTLITFNKTLHKDLCDLDYLDYLCIQRDHWPRNLVVLFNDVHEPCGIKCFDNDYETTFHPKFKFPPKEVYDFSNVVVDKCVNRPFISEQLYGSILALTKKNIKANLSTYLTKVQLVSLNRRVMLLQKALKNSYSKGTLYIVKESEWDDTIINKEDFDRYGLTTPKMFFNALIENKKNI